MNQGCPPADGNGHMDRFGHLCKVRPLFQAGLGVGIDAIRALNRVGNGKRDQGFFSFSQFAFGKNGLVIIKKFFASSGASLPICSNFGRSSGV